MIQQGQVFKLKATSVDGEPLWAYRYRVAGRDSARRQAGGFTTKAEAQRALQNRLARLLPGGRAGTLTLAEWVEEYLGSHQSGRAPLRSDPGAAAGAESSGQLEADRRQPREVRVKSRSALPGAAAVRLLAADPVAGRELGPTHGPMVLFAAATGLRPSELFALEQGDVDRAAGVVQIRRAYANGRVSARRRG